MEEAKANFTFGANLLFSPGKYLEHLPFGYTSLYNLNSRQINLRSKLAIYKDVFPVEEAARGGSGGSFEKSRVKQGKLSCAIRVKSSVSAPH